jgi:hypothetical protein
VPPAEDGWQEAHGTFRWANEARLFAFGVGLICGVVIGIVGG